MANETEFVGGLIVKAPNENAPEYVIAKLSIKREEMIAWLQGRDGEWINAEVKESKGGKLYAAVDNWKPNGGGKQTEARQEAKPAPARAPADDDFADDDIPF